MKPDSSLTVIYLPSFTSFTIDLSGFRSPLRTTWINPVSGKSYKGKAFPANYPQIFFPPVTEENKDWLLIIQMKP
ncbi:MAG: hypothetical protein HC905_14050 [Bacteroidales bacterium]|nr:hypothetical protein [Bacteroidales bacterium]